MGLFLLDGHNVVEGNVLEAGEVGAVLGGYATASNVLRFEQVLGPRGLEFRSGHHTVTVAAFGSFKRPVETALSVLGAGGLSRDVVARLGTIYARGGRALDLQLVDGDDISIQCFNLGAHDLPVDEGLVTSNYVPLRVKLSWLTRFRISIPPGWPSLTGRAPAPAL